MATSGDEFYSDDSLEVEKKPNRKLKPKRVDAKRKQSYLQLYQHRLASEFRKLGVSRDNICHPTRSNSPAAAKSEEAEVSQEEANPKKSISQPALNGRNVSKMWSEFLSRKSKYQRPRSDADKKAEMVKKRLEYGKRMTQINRFNIKCMSSEPVKKALKPEKMIETAKIQLPPVEAQSVPEIEESNRLVEIDKKITLLRRRHLSNKKIVEKIKAELKIVEE